MSGAQAQLNSAAHISLWSRIEGLQIKDIEESLMKRRLVKAACMRRTLFLVPAADLATFVRGSARRAEKGIRWARGKGVSDRAIEASIDAALEALDEPRTRPEIAERVSRILGVIKREVHGGGWGSRRKVAAVPVGHIAFPIVDLLHLAGARGVVCYGPDRGNEPTFVRADAWIPNWRDQSQEDAEDQILRTYLHAHGPSTAADFALWSGMSLTEAREIWGRIQAEIVPVEVEGWPAAVLRKDMKALEQSEFQRPLVRLVPYFDSFLLGHKERHHLVDVKHQPKIFRPQGWISPAVLVDGRVAATWKHSVEGNHLRVSVEGFQPMTRRIMAGIRAEAHTLGRFLGIQTGDVLFS